MSQFEFQPLIILATIQTLTEVLIATQAEAEQLRRENRELRAQLPDEAQATGR